MDSTRDVLNTHRVSRTPRSSSSPLIPARYSVRDSNQSTGAPPARALAAPNATTTAKSHQHTTRPAPRTDSNTGCCVVTASPPSGLRHTARPDSQAGRVPKRSHHSTPARPAVSNVCNMLPSARHQRFRRLRRKFVHGNFRYGHSRPRRRSFSHRRKGSPRPCCTRNCPFNDRAVEISVCFSGRAGSNVFVRSLALSGRDVSVR